MKKAVKFLAMALLTGGLAAFTPASLKVQAENEEIWVFPNLYEDGTQSPVTSDGNRIFANGTSLIFKDGKMYEDMAPQGVFDTNDRHIYTAPYVEIDGVVIDEGNYDEKLDMVYLETGGADNTEYGDCQITIEDTTLRGVYVNHVKNVSVTMKNASVLRHYIENAAGNVDYTIESNTGDIQEIYMMDSEAGNRGENGGLVQGNLNINLNHVKNQMARINILASGTVIGDTRITVNDSVVYGIDAAHITGTAAKKGNVFVEANDSKIGHITGTSIGYYGTQATVNGDIDIKVKNSTMEFGITNYTGNTYYSTMENFDNIVTGKGTVLVENSDIQYVRDKTNKTHNGEIGKNTEVTIKDSDINEVTSEVVNVHGKLYDGKVNAGEFHAKDNAVLTGGLRAENKVSGQFTWQPRNDKYSVMEVGQNAVIENGTRIHIVPVKGTEAGYVPLAKTEKLQNEVRVEFEKRGDAADYLKNFTCDYNEMRVYGRGSYTGDTYSGIEVMNYCAIHNWKKASLSGYSHIMDYANEHDKAATCVYHGAETYYCTICEKYEVRTIKALGHNYYIESVKAPTTSQKGYTVYKCSRCSSSYKGNYTDKLSAKKSVSKLKYSMTSSYSYTGKSIKPSVTVKDGRKKLRVNKDYTISYKNNKNIGTATVTIKGKGNYTGTKKLTFKIVPKKNSITYIKSKKTKTLSLNWKKDTKVNGYILQYSTDKNFRKNVKKITINKNRTTSATIKGLKSKKTYYVRIVSYKKVSGKTYTGKYSTVKKVRVK